MLRELTEIGITQDLVGSHPQPAPGQASISAYARRFALAGLSQYLLGHGRSLARERRPRRLHRRHRRRQDHAAREARRTLGAATRHARPRASGRDTVRIGAQDQMQTLGQLLGVPVYTPENFESLPTLLSPPRRPPAIHPHRHPGLEPARSATRAAGSRVLANCASQLETALVLAASTQAGAIEEAVKRFAPANPAAAC